MRGLRADEAVLGEPPKIAGRGVTDESQAASNLSARERDVLILVASGKSSKQIAEQLGIAFRTVVVHRQNHHTKLHVHKAVDLARAAIRLGLIES